MNRKPRQAAPLPPGIALVLTFVLAATAFAAPRPCTSEDRDVYGQALCLYNDGRFEEAQTAFSVIVEIGLENPETIKAHYYLARIAMRQQRWADASERLVTIYKLSPGFYREWGCDYLLGVAREKLDGGT